MLHDLGKKDVIAVGFCQRRVENKIADGWTTDKLLCLVAPHQLEVGVCDVVEAFFHAARTFVAFVVICSY